MTTTITTRTDLITYLNNVRADLTPFAGYVDAVADQIQFSDHPAWGQDWAEWLDAELPTLVEATVDGLVALEGTETGYARSTSATEAFLNTCPAVKSYKHLGNDVIEFDFDPSVEVA